MASLNRVQLIGRLGKDPELRQSGSGVAICNFSLATSERYKDSSGEWQEKTEWHKITAFGNRGEVLAKHTHKGSQLYVEGALSTRKWDDKDGNTRYTTEIVLRDFQFLDSKGDYQGKSVQVQSSGTQDRQEVGHPSNPIVNDEDIPF